MRPGSPTAAPVAWVVPHVDPERSLDGWTGVPALPPLTLASGQGLALRQTDVRLAWDENGLHVRFACDDVEPRATRIERDGPLWDEEVVEIFLAPGAGTPAVYHELEFNPLGAVFDAVVHNPDGVRRTMTVDASWNCQGLRWSATRAPAGSWTVVASIPWRGLGCDHPPRRWRANVFRIERPVDAPAEFSCWIPTLTDPPDFHRPERFGLLRLGDSMCGGR